MKLLLSVIIFTISLQANEIVDRIKQEEGFSSTMYQDTSNQISIGYGTNLSYGITEAEAELLLIHRLEVIHAKLTSYHWYNKLTFNRKYVIISMAYQLGFTGLFQFKHFIWRVQHGYYKAASNAMLESLWAQQTPNRAKRLSKLMLKG
jgi:lysozyme